MILAFLACTAEYRAADLQLDVSSALPTGAETLRICAEGWGSYELGAGNGRAALAGLTVGAEYLVTINVFGEDGMLGAAGPITLGASRAYVEAAYREGAEGECVADGEPVSDGEESWLLAVRFDEEATPWDQF